MKTLQTIGLLLLLSISSLTYSKEFSIPQLPIDVSCWNKSLSNKDIETCNQLIFMDVDFDGQNEIIKREFRDGQRGRDRFIIYKHSGKEMEGMQVKAMDSPPFNNIDSGTIFDTSNKTILIDSSGGACGSEYRTYKKISSKWIVIKQIVYNQDGWDKGDNTCYKSIYEIRYDNEMGGEQKTDAQKFIKHILNGEYDQSYQYVDDNFSWRSENGDKIYIKNKKDYISVAPKIFNDAFIEAVNKTEKIEVTCCLSSIPILHLESNEIIFWFMEGKPWLLSNNTIINPSFNCSDARAESEHSICQSLPLSVQDQLLSSTYKEAKVFLTNDYKNLKTDQIAFIKDRNSCKKNVECIKRKTKERIKKLDYLIKKSYKNHIVKKFYPKDIPRKLISKKYYSAGYIGKYSNDEMKDIDKFNIKIITGDDYINISNGNDIKAQHCYIDGQTNTTFANVYYNTMYKNNYFGSSGGSYTQTPYFGYHILFNLKLTETKASCGYLMVNFNVNTEPLFSYSNDEPIDGLLISDGHILTSK
jgi:uncharacterized protein